MQHLIFSDDESICVFRTPIVDKNPNKIEVFRNNNFAEPAATIHAKF